MRNSLRILIPIFVAGFILVFLPTSAVRLSAHAEAQEPDPVVTWQIVVNQARLDEGLAPYGFSGLLTIAAQRHADDVAAHGFTDSSDVHLGSDGTHEQQRVAEAGYSAWTWNSGELTVDENMWSGQGTIEDAMTFFLSSEVHRNNISSSIYREIGIGVAADTVGRNYHVLVFGVRPNVLPIFINDGANSTDNPQVAIRLTNEEARPGGEGAAFMGWAIEIRISNEPSWDDRPWQPWEPLVPWTLPDTPGEHTVYVQFRDAAGRTAASPDTIFLSEGTYIAPTPVPPSSTPEPAATPVPPSPTTEPTATPAPTVLPTSELTPTVEPTLAQLPSPTPLPSAMPAPAAATPFPTWTPLPTAAPQEANGPDMPLGMLAVLQVVALILGIYLALRRGREEQDTDTLKDRVT